MRASVVLVFFAGLVALETFSVVTERSSLLELLAFLRWAGVCATLVSGFLTVICLTSFTVRFFATVLCSDRTFCLALRCLFCGTARVIFEDFLTVTDAALGLKARLGFELTAGAVLLADLLGAALTFRGLLFTVRTDELELALLPAKLFVSTVRVTDRFDFLGALVAAGAGVLLRTLLFGVLRTELLALLC